MRQQKKATPNVLIIHFKSEALIRLSCLMFCVYAGGCLPFHMAPILLFRLSAPKHHYEPREEDEESDIQKDLPEWFNPQPFQYNGRVCLVAIPGLVLVLALAGEM